MKIEKFAETAIPVIFGIIVLLMVLYFVISAGLGILLLWLLLIPVYFVPSVWAYKKNHKFKKQILLLNIFLGFSYVGWVLALIWASLNENN